VKRFVDLGFGMPPVLRLGLAARGDSRLEAHDVFHAWEQGLNYWNWCGEEDGMCEAIRDLGRKRTEVVIASQISVDDWSRDTMRFELDRALKKLKTDWLDIVTLYYVESESEWSEILSEDGALRALKEAKQEGRIRAIGLTTHQRPLAANWVKSGELDLLMIRYNAAHRGVETDVFPITDELGVPVVCFTCLRWGALMKPTRNDPADFRVPVAREWYRFVLSNRSVGVALTAPNTRAELLENLALLEDWRETTAEERDALKGHGDRVRESAGPFP
jgi:aryl-alcohol dehydrogenase-like predicted oxidoreductase